MYMCLFLGSLCYDLCVNFCFDYCSFVLLSEHRKHISSFVLFQDCSDYLWVFLYVCGSVLILGLFILLLLFSCSVMSDSLQPHGLQHARPLCPSPSPEVFSSSCPLHWWYHLAISSSDTLFSFCTQSYSTSGTFPMSQFFASDDQNTGVSASALVLPTSIQDWFLFRLTGLISLLSKGLPGVLSSTTVRRHQFFSSVPSLWSSSHNHTWPLGKTIALTVCTFVSRVMSLIFNTLSRFVIAFLPRSKPFLISRLQSPSAVILEPKKRKSVTTFTFSPYICHEVVGPDAMILVFFLFFFVFFFFSFKLALSLSSFTVI